MKKLRYPHIFLITGDPMIIKVKHWVSVAWTFTGWPLMISHPLVCSPSTEVNICSCVMGRFIITANLSNEPCPSQSDCEVIIPLIQYHGIEKALDLMNGDFAFVYTDGTRVMAARDPVGVRPLFYTRYGPDSIAFASEVKALLFLNSKIDIFPPGHFYDSYFDNFVCYHTGYWRVHKYIKNGFIPQLRKTFEEAVHVRIDNTERDIGFLLSGGLDSSLIASIATRKLGKIRTFSIGLKGVRTWKLPELYPNT